MTKLLTLPELVDVLKCSKSTVYVLIRREGFPVPFKVGRNNCWIADEVEEWLAQQAAARVA